MTNAERLERHRLANERWRARNPDKARGATLKWRASNPDKLRESYRKSARKWSAANPDKIAEIHRMKRAANPDKYRGIIRRWCAANPDKKRPSRIAWRRANPEAALAHTAVNYAIKTGELHRQPCQICGNPRSHAHHDDYSKPLVVRWLCAIHHKLWHKVLDTLFKRIIIVGTQT